MRELNWFERGRGSSDGDIRRFELEHGVDLPVEVADFLRSHAGDTNPDESEFDFDDRTGRRITGNFGCVVDVGVNSDEYVGRLMGEIEGLPSGLVPIVATGSGDYVCADVQARNGRIVLYRHELTGDDCVVPLAPDLATFLDQLRVPDGLWPR